MERMAEQKKRNKKERNYSVWFTGIVLILVYVILIDSMSKAEEKACRSLLREQMQEVSEDLPGNSCGFSNKMLQSP